MQNVFAKATDKAGEFSQVAKDIGSIADENARLLVEMGIALKNFDNAKYLETINAMWRNNARLLEVTKAKDAK